MQDDYTKQTRTMFTHPDECEMGHGEDCGPRLEVCGDGDREVLERSAPAGRHGRVRARVEDVAHHPGGVDAVARPRGRAAGAGEEADGD